MVLARGRSERGAALGQSKIETSRGVESPPSREVGSLPAESQTHWWGKAVGERKRRNRGWRMKKQSDSAKCCNEGGSGRRALG